jgi:membrane protease YdiL (CAAX protease family)
MKENSRKQLVVFGVFLFIYACLAFATYLLIPLDQLAPTQTAPLPTEDIPPWQLGLANAGIVIVLYGLAGLAGIWFARKLEIPAIYRAGAGWRAWALWPALLGLVVGVIFVIVDQVFANATGTIGFAHPTFPFSLIASASAGIGEEIMFRGFMMGLWAFLFNLFLRRWIDKRTALWAGNVIAALAFSAGHLPVVMAQLGVTALAEIPTWVLAEGFLLNSLVALVAGERYMKDGLLAAMGVHFWTDIVWHVLWPLFG